MKNVNVEVKLGERDGEIGIFIKGLPVDFNSLEHRKILSVAVSEMLRKATGQLLNENNIVATEIIHDLGCGQN